MTQDNKVQIKLHNTQLTSFHSTPGAKLRFNTAPQRGQSHLHNFYFITKFPSQLS